MIGGWYLQLPMDHEKFVRLDIFFVATSRLQDFSGIDRLLRF